LGDIKWEWDWGGEKNGKDCLFLFFFLFIWPKLRGIVEVFWVVAGIVVEYREYIQVDGII
jgi:hypothetical protein